MANADTWQAALDALRPLEARLDAALSAGDMESAVRMAFAGAEQAVALVAGTADQDAPRMHKVYVELTPLPLDAYEDGTLRENGAYVHLTYQCLAIDTS